MHPEAWNNNLDQDFINKLPKWSYHYYVPNNDIENNSYNVVCSIYKLHTEQCILNYIDTLHKTCVQNGIICIRVIIKKSV
jgi:hypothetical protein